MEEVSKMRRMAMGLMCLCFAWLIHFHGGSTLRVDKIDPRHLDDYYGRRAYVMAEVGGKAIIIPWFNVLYMEEVS